MDKIINDRELLIFTCAEALRPEEIQSLKELLKSWMSDVNLQKKANDVCC